MEHSACSICHCLSWPCWCQDSVACAIGAWAPVLVHALLCSSGSQPASLERPESPPSLPPSSPESPVLTAPARRMRVAGCRRVGVGGRVGTTGPLTETCAQQSTLPEPLALCVRRPQAPPNTMPKAAASKKTEKKAPAAKGEKVRGGKREARLHGGQALCGCGSSCVCVCPVPTPCLPSHTGARPVLSGSVNPLSRATLPPPPPLSPLPLALSASPCTGCFLTSSLDRSRCLLLPVSLALALHLRTRHTSSSSPLHTCLSQFAPRAARDPSCVGGQPCCLLFTHLSSSPRQQSLTPSPSSPVTLHHTPACLTTRTRRRRRTPMPPSAASAPTCSSARTCARP